MKNIQNKNGGRSRSGRRYATKKKAPLLICTILPGSNYAFDAPRDSDTVTAVVGGAVPTLNKDAGLVLIQGLVAIAGAVDTVVINNNRVTINSRITVTVMQYSGTIVTNGIPYVFNAMGGAGTITISTLNIHGANALAGNLLVSLQVNAEDFN
jgi:hypothetical protein